jgi:hypothetical protein
LHNVFYGTARSFVAFFDERAKQKALPEHSGRAFLRES